MIKLQIKSINNYNYILQSTNEDTYKLNIGFINIDKKPTVGDYLYLTDDVVLENNMYTYGPIYNQYKDDIIKVETQNDIYYLQRYYG